MNNSLLGFPGGASDKEPACQCRGPKRCRFDPWVRKILWRRAWQPTPVFLLENPMDRGAWWAIVHSGVAESYPVHCWMFHSLPGLCSLDASSTLPIGTHTHTHTHTHTSLDIAKCPMRGKKGLLLRNTTLENLKYSWKFYHILLVKTSHKHGLDSNLMAARRPGSLGATKVTDCHNSVRLTLKCPYYNVKLRLIVPEPCS